MLVVVVDVVDNESFELVLVPDDGSVEKVASDRSDPALSEGVRDWCSNGCFEDGEFFGSEDLIERANELATSIANQGTRSGDLFGMLEEQVAGCLGGPGSGWVGGGPGVEDLPGGDVDEEQDVDPFECGGVDGEEVAGDRGLRVEEL